MTSPVVSVVMATYNHASYVAEAINSVLQQKDVDFEFLIADDGSTDATVHVVESIKDSRIRFFPHKKNRGACVVTNELIEQASGQFVALINSDDRWIGSDKLAFQLEIMRINPLLGACFSKAHFMDKRGTVLKNGKLPFGNIFEQENRSQGAWLRHFFESGNCICHPTMLIRRQCYDEVGGYNNNFRQLPDFDMWVRLVKRYPIYITERKLIEFRVSLGESASSQTISNSIRIVNEHYLIAENFFNGVSAQQLAEGFFELLKYPDLPSQVHVDIEKVLLLFIPNRSLGQVYKLIGLLKLNHLLASTTHQPILAEYYGIDGRWFQKQMAEIDILRPEYLVRLSQYKWWLTWLQKRVLG